MATMAGHSELVTGLAFSNDCRHLISVSGMLIKMMLVLMMFLVMMMGLMVMMVMMMVNYNYLSNVCRRLLRVCLEASRGDGRHNAGKNQF